MLHLYVNIVEIVRYQEVEVDLYTDRMISCFTLDEHISFAGIRYEAY